MSRSFSLLEMTLVLIILALIISFNFEPLTYTFNNISSTHQQTSKQLILHNTLSTLSKRLQQAIPSSIQFNEEHNAILYFGSEYEAFRGYQLEGESINSAHLRLLQPDTTSPITTLNLENTSLSKTATIIKAITGARLSHQSDVVLIFDKPYSTDSFWLNQSAYQKVVCEQSDCSSGRLTLESPIDALPSQRYYLSSTAYAILLDAPHLYLYRNFQPWQGEEWHEGEKILLAEGITSFTYAPPLLTLCIDHMCLSKVIQ
jgi:type II secretory pathway pseudopilin PulG